MWQLRNQTPFPAELRAYRTHDDAAYWGLWVGASFELRPDAPPLFLADQPPLGLSPEFAEDGSVRVDGDLVPHKEYVDLIVFGHAMQPPAEAELPHRVALQLGEWRKGLEVYPPLAWTRPGRVTVDEDTPPARVSLGGTDSFGGADHAENPIGRGHGLPERETEDLRLSDMPPPAVVFPAGEEPPRRGAPGAVGRLGPLSRLWEVRAALGGTYDETWQERRAPLLPTDLDPAYWQAAPADQRLTRPLPEAPVLFAGGFDSTGTVEAHTSYPLPVLALECDTLIRGAWQAAEAMLQTIEVDLDARQVRLVYHAAWPITRAASDVDIGQTAVSLTDTKSFRVPAAEASRFHIAPSERSIAS